MGKCKPASVFASGLYDSYSAKKTYFIDKDGTKRKFQKWCEKDKAELERLGVMSVPLKDVLQEVCQLGSLNDIMGIHQPGNVIKLQRQDVMLSRKVLERSSRLLDVLNFPRRLLI